MKKPSVSFVCQECGYDSPKFLGKCPECGNWNSLREITSIHYPAGSSDKNTSGPIVPITPKTLDQIHYEPKQRLQTGFTEMDSVFGGGIVRGSVTLLAGDPGVGKSTLLLQVGLSIAASGKTVLYISGEESEEQIKLRTGRVGKKSNDKNFLLLSLTNVDAAVATIQKIKPAFAIIDSIQTMESSAAGGLSGSVSQIRYATSVLIQAAKTLGIPMLLVGHVTKEGMVAGPMVLSHMVDTVLFLEGDKETSTRVLRSFKNRFGPVDEVGIFSMEESGVQEIRNPEQMFLSESKKDVPGSVFVATLEGTRAFIVEIQALAVFSKLPMPRRVVSGIDPRRVELLLAVLQKHCKLPVETMDVFVNVAGGMKLSDAGCDLGICLAIYSSLRNISLQKTVAIAEVGLLGELRTVSGFDKRAKEAKKLGFRAIMSAKTHEMLREVISSFEKGMPEGEVQNFQINDWKAQGKRKKY